MLLRFLLQFYSNRRGFTLFDQVFFKIIIQNYSKINTKQFHVKCYDIIMTYSHKN